VDIIDTRTNLVRVSVSLEGVEQLHVTLGSLDRDDVSIQGLDGWEDVVKVRVAEMRVGLGLVAYTGSGELEGASGPFEVGVPVCTAERETFTKSRLVDLDGSDTGRFEVDDFVPEGKSELLGLECTGDIGTREGPVEDGDGASQHTLHGLGGEALSILGPADGDGALAADVRDDNGRTDVTESIVSVEF